MTAVESQYQGILDRITTVENRLPFIKVLIYGDPGVGKTVFAGSAPKPLFLDVEHGTTSLLNHPELRNTDVITVKNWSDIEEIFWACKNGEVPHETIVIDSISELQKRQMDESLERGAKMNPSKSAFLPQMLDYKENTEVLRRMVIAFRDLEKNLVIVAHSQLDKNEATGDMYWRPAVTPKLSTTLTGFMDVVGYMKKDVVKQGGMDVEMRKLQVHPTAYVVAKTRLGGLPTIIEGPSFQTLLDALKIKEEIL
jgi:phage nucleotide-binding protein